MCKIYARHGELFWSNFKTQLPSMKLYWISQVVEFNSCSRKYPTRLNQVFTMLRLLCVCYLVCARRHTQGGTSKISSSWWTVLGDFCVLFPPAGQQNNPKPKPINNEIIDCVCGRLQKTVVFSPAEPNVRKLVEILRLLKCHISYLPEVTENISWYISIWTCKFPLIWSLPNADSRNTQDYLYSVELHT